MTKAKLMQFRFISKSAPDEFFSYSYTTVKAMIQWANKTMSPSVTKHFLCANKGNNFVYANYAAFAEKTTPLDNNPAKSRTRYLSRYSSSFSALVDEELAQLDELVTCPALGDDEYLQLIPTKLAVRYLESVFPGTPVCMDSTIQVYVNDPFEAVEEPDKPSVRATSAPAPAAHEEDEIDIGIDEASRARSSATMFPGYCTLNKYQLGLGVFVMNKFNSDHVIFSISKSKPGVLIVRAGTQETHSTSFYGDRKRKNKSSTVGITLAQQEAYLGHVIERGRYAAEWDEQSQKLYIDFNKKVGDM